MHIAEGYLPVGWAAGWGVVCVPFVVAGFLSIQKKVGPGPQGQNPVGDVRSVRLCALRAENPLHNRLLLPPHRRGLGAILFGPMTMAVLG